MSNHAADLLQRARQAARQGNAASMHAFYAASITSAAVNREAGAIFTEYLDAARRCHRAARNIVDIAKAGALSQLLPTPAAQKTFETQFERLRVNPYDIDAVYRLGRAAENLCAHTLTIAALADVLQHSGILKSQPKVTSEIRLAIGKAHFQLGEFERAISQLQLVSDPAASKDVQQMIKDASASLAATSMQGQSAHKIATAHSVALATQTPQERQAQEVAQLQSVVVDANADRGTRVTAALRLAEAYAHARALDQALNVLRQLKGVGISTGDLEKKRADLELQRRDEAIIQALSQPGNGKTLIESLQVEREQHAVKVWRELAAALPSDPECHLKLGEALLTEWQRSRDQEAAKEAVAHLQFEYKNREQISRSRVLLAQSFVALELPAAAEIILSEFLSMSEAKGGEHYLDTQYLLGVVREMLGDNRGAISAYVAVIGRDIKFKDAFDRLKKLSRTSSAPAV